MHVADRPRVVAQRDVDGISPAERPAVRPHQIRRVQLPHAIERGCPFQHRAVRLPRARQHRETPIKKVARQQRFKIGQPYHQVIHRFSERVVQLETHAAFGKLVLLVEGDLRRDVSALARMQKIHAQSCASILARHMRGPLHLVQPPVVPEHQPVLAHLLDVILLRDHFGIGPGKTFAP